MKTTVKIINKYLALSKPEKGTSEIIANPYTMVKQELLWENSGKKKPLPRFSYDFFNLSESLPDLVYWFDGLSQPNHPTDINYSTDPQKYRDFVEKIDLSKPYNERVIKELQELFKGTAANTKPINADDIINAELEGDLDD